MIPPRPTLPQDIEDELALLVQKCLSVALGATKTELDRRQLDQTKNDQLWQELSEIDRTAVQRGVPEHQVLERFNELMCELSPSWANRQNELKRWWG